MSRFYRKVIVKDYVVSLNAVYNIHLPDIDDVGEAEEKACDLIQAELEKRDCDELDIYITEDINSLMGYIIKVSINMVVPVVAGNFEEALRLAEGFIADMNMPNGVNLISVGSWDSALSKEKEFLLRCKGA